MRSLVLEETRQLAWQEVPEPRREHEREAIVRPLAVAACDLDQPMIMGRTPFPYPIHLGHECVAEIVEGPDSFAPGDRVVIPFQISCGTCERCRRGLTGNCERVPPLSMYGFGALGGDWGGMLSDLALVPYAEGMLVPLPKAVEHSLVASAADNMADGWRTVAPALADFPGADVLVVSGGAMRSIPLYAVDAALALGAGSVTCVDTDPVRLGVAQALGAKVFDGHPDQSLGAFRSPSTGPAGLKVSSPPSVSPIRADVAPRSASSKLRLRCHFLSSTAVGYTSTSGSAPRARQCRRWSNSLPPAACGLSW
jgi:alcohol dehydrogenase